MGFLIFASAIFDLNFNLIAEQFISYYLNYVAKESFTVSYNFFWAMPIQFDFLLLILSLLLYFLTITMW